jgi:ketosteroid isomerase-like protein
MSQENVEVVRQAFEASKRHDNETALSFYDREVEIEPLFHDRTYRGLDGVRAFWGDWLGVMTSYDGEVDEWIDAGDQVIAVMHTWARGKMSGVNVERREAHLWTLQDGKLRRLRVFATKDEALEAAGLRQ